jgi:hypothetical protein
MAALLAGRRLGASAPESVDELAQPEQITEPAEIMGRVIGVDRQRSCRRLRLPIGPTRRDQRPAAVRQNGEEIGDAAPPDGADHGQRPTFESVTLPRDRHRSGKIMAMGSLWPLRSTGSTTID